MRSLRAPRVAFLLVFLALLSLAPGAVASEPFFPAAGSRAYDVSRYDVRLAYRPNRGGRIDATATIVAVSREQLTDFSLDFLGPRVGEVRVDSERARFERGPGKLRIFPSRAIAGGGRFEATNEY